MSKVLSFSASASSVRDTTALNGKLATWIKAAHGGDVRSFEALYDATSGWLLARIRRIVGGLHCEDVLAEVYLQVWRSLGTYEPGRGEPLAWLATISRARAMDRIRHEKVRHAEFEIPLDESHEVAGPASLEPDQQLWRSQASALLKSTLATLSGKERMVLGLAYLQECTHSEIASLTGLPLGTVKTLLSRSQVKLRRRFSEDMGTPSVLGYHWPQPPAISQAGAP